MKILESGEQLLHDVGCHFFREKLFVDDVVEEFSTLTILQDKEADFVPLPDFVQLDDVWVVLNLLVSDFQVLTKVCRILTSLMKVLKFFTFFF